MALADNLNEKAKVVLENRWKLIQSEDFKEPAIDPGIRKCIRESINSKTLSYRYVLPTQLLAKVVEPTLDARCLQAQRGGPGAFDARSLSKSVIVPFDRGNHEVLGGSPEPYVNNPLRVPEVSSTYRNQEKDKVGWDCLDLVLSAVQEGKLSAENALELALKDIHSRLSLIDIVYPIPKRVSIDTLVYSVDRFCSLQSSGEHPMSVAYAIFKTIADTFQFFSDVQRAKATESDTASGRVADIECFSDGELVLAVEVKDQELILNHVQDKITRARTSSVSELMFLIQKGLKLDEKGDIDDLVKKEFSGGLNIYIFELLNFARVVLSMLGEKNRTLFLKNISYSLDNFGAKLESKKQWVKILSEM